MEFLYAQLRYSSYNGSSSSSSSSTDWISMQKKVGLVVSSEKPFKENHIVFSTRNLTKSMTKIASDEEGKAKAPRDNPTIRIAIPEQACLLASHGVRRGRGPASLTQTLTLLPLTVCTRHGATSFLPLDYVQTMAEYTRTTHSYPIFRVVHRFHDCVLEFPIPPPIGSSEEQSSDFDYSKNCYQCFTPLSNRKTAYMYRDYLFCCHGCRLKACATRYWYKKVMKSAEEDQITFHVDSISATAIHNNALFTILS